MLQGLSSGSTTTVTVQQEPLVQEERWPDDLQSMPQDHHIALGGRVTPQHMCDTARKGHLRQH